MSRWLAVALALALVSCGHDAAPAGPPSCQDRCVAYARSCANDTAQCPSVCQWITDAQLTCLEHASCEHDRVAMCLPPDVDGGAGAGGAGTGGGSGLGAGGGSSGGSSMTACVGLGEPGCTNAAAGPNCCAPGTCDEKKGVCCVQKASTPCKTDGDCCGASAQCVPNASGTKTCTVPQ